MKVKIQSPLATMTAELTAEQALAIYGQVLEWITETAEDLDEPLDEEESQSETTEPPEPTSDPFFSAANQDRLTKTIEAFQKEYPGEPILGGAERLFPDPNVPPKKNDEALADDEVSYVPPEPPAHPMCKCALPEQDTTPPKKSSQSYYGFLYIRCEHCGKTKGFCTKKPLKIYHCDCGHETQLENLKVAEVFCNNCEQFFTYRTNIKDYNFVINCVHCESPVDMILNKPKTKYIALSKVKW